MGGGWHLRRPLIFATLLLVSVARLGAQPQGRDELLSLLEQFGVLGRQGAYAEQIEIGKSILAQVEQRFGPEDGRVAKAMKNLAGVYLSLDRLTEAEPLLRRSLAINERVHGPKHSDVGVSLNDLAGLYLKQGRSVEAKTLIERGLAILEAVHGKDHVDVARVLGNLAAAEAALGRNVDAVSHRERALTIFEQTLNFVHPELMLARINLAELYTRQSDTSKAEELLVDTVFALENVLDAGHPLVAQALNLQALVMYRQGRYEEAEPILQKVLAISEERLGQDHENVAFVLGNIGILAFERQEWRRATDFLWRGARLWVRLADRDSSALGRALVGKDRSEARRYDSVFRALVKATHRLLLHEGNADAGLSSSEVFQVAQWALASEAAEAVANMAARSAKDVIGLGKMVRERQDLVGEWYLRDRLRIEAFPLLSDRPDRAVEVGDALSAIQARIAEIDRRLQMEFPDYAALARPTPLSVEEVQAELSANEALVLFLDTPTWGSVPEETFGWVVTKSEVRWVRSELGTAALGREVTALRCGLDETAWDGDGRNSCTKALGVPHNKPLPFDHSRAHKLYLGLFGEVQDLIKGKHLLIVPSGPLTQLPFHVLVTRPATSDDHRAIAWLAREHAVTVLPAVSSLKALRRVSKSSAASRPMIGFGNPLLDGPDARYAGLAKLARDTQRCADVGRRSKAARAGLRAGALRVETRGGLADLAHLKMQAPLPETADELCAVARAVKAEVGDIRLGAQATEREIKRLSVRGELAKYRIVHFATHGVLAGQIDSTHEPGLILSPPGKATEEDDGYLSASEIAALKLDADWVILSACNTAAGATGSAEALSGLARAFIYAQARALLVSHWEVYSDAAVKLVTGAAREMATNANVGRAGALRSSMLAMIDRGKPHEAHPAYWAPFVVVGEGAPGR